MQAMQPIMMMLVMFGIFYFILIRPQVKRQREHSSMLQKLGKGDEVITRGGVIGKITGISDDGILVLDPFNKGRPVSAEELKERASPHLGGRPPDDVQLIEILAPASHRTILARMLRNLNGLYLESGDWERVARTADRLLKLSPDTPDALRDRGLAYRELGHAHGARDDLGRYLQLAPQADDSDKVRGVLVELSGQRARIN